MMPVAIADVPSFAKLNLTLRVLHKRPDGFHELRTVFQTISLADRLRIECGRARRSQVELESTVEIADNIAVKAAYAALDALGVKARVRMRLEKRIPMGGGLGGGSSNAAAVLRALPVLLGRRADPQLLLRVGASLGSDVPFFLLGGTALAMGRGEELYPFAEPPRSHGVLVLPGLHVSTAEAYKALGRTAEPRAELAAAFAQQSWPIRSGMPLPLWDGFCANDFEPAVFALHPEIGRLRQRLERLGARPARMTGSGSTVFGFFPSKAAARDAASRITGAIAFETVSRRRYAEAWDKAVPGYSCDFVGLLGDSPKSNV